MRGIMMKWEEDDRVSPGNARNGSSPLSGQSARVMAIASGKGGVGKSNIAVNLAMALDLMGKKVLIMDANLGLAGIDVLLGLDPTHNISHVLAGEKELSDVIVNGPGNIHIIPAGSGIQELSRLTDGQKHALTGMFGEMEAQYDIILIDTGPGLTDTMLFFSLAASEKIVVVTPEPASLLDGYALVKVLHMHGVCEFGILANGVADENDGMDAFTSIGGVVDLFLPGLSFHYLGAIPLDPAVCTAVRCRRALLDMYPESAASKAFGLLAANVLKKAPPGAGCKTHGAAHSRKHQTL